MKRNPLLLFGLAPASSAAFGGDRASKVAAAPAAPQAAKATAQKPKLTPPTL